MPEDRWMITDADVSQLDALHALVSEPLIHDTFSKDLLEQKLFFDARPERDIYRTFLAVAGGEPAGMLQLVMRPEALRAWIGLFAVAPVHRRQGLAKRLFQHAHSICRQEGLQTVDVLGVPTNYLTPGIDPRYTAGICLLESLGYAHRGERLNLRARLEGDFSTADEEADLHKEGITIRRAVLHEDDKAMADFFGRNFGEDWLMETSLAMNNDPPGVHLALRGDVVLGFAAHSAMNEEWGNFGPMGTADAEQGMGIGRILLYRCMADLKAAGFASALIPWVGPYRFYCRHLDCSIDRVFWQYRLELGDA